MKESMRRKILLRMNVEITRKEQKNRLPTVVTNFHEESFDGPGEKFRPLQECKMTGPRQNGFCSCQDGGEEDRLGDIFHTRGNIIGSESK